MALLLNSAPIFGPTFSIDKIKSESDSGILFENQSFKNLIIFCAKFSGS